MKGNSYLRFRKLAPWYDAGLKLITRPFGGEAALRGKVLGLLPLHAGDSVLEVGCGTGTAMSMAADRVGPGGEVVGIDPSAEMIAHARVKIAKIPQASVLQGAGAPLPFSDCSFNAVIFFLVLHEMAHEDRIDSLREALRVLKPGGHLLVGEFGRPESAAVRLLQQLILLVEEKEATDFLVRGLPMIIDEGCAGELTEVKRERLALGLLQGVLYVKKPEKS